MVTAGKLDVLGWLALRRVTVATSSRYTGFPPGAATTTRRGAAEREEPAGFEDDFAALFNDAARGAEVGSRRQGLVPPVRAEAAGRKTEWDPA